MLTPGPRTTAMPCARASAPRAAPTSRARSGSQEDASAEAVGKAGGGHTAVLSSGLSPGCGCLRSPCGPSDTMTDSMPNSPTGAVCQKSEPRHKAAFCGTLSSATVAAERFVIGHARTSLAMAVAVGLGECRSSTMASATATVPQPAA